VEPWLASLREGDPQTAWNLFERRYRPLILATIRRLVQDHDDVMEVFATVCAALVADDFARLRRYSDRSPTAAAVSTWLVIVVRNLVIDWIRKARGRNRASVPPDLSGLQREIYSALCVDELSPIAAYESIRTRSGLEISFAEFLREFRRLRQSHPCPEAMPLRRPEPLSAMPELSVSGVDPAEISDLARHLASALALQPDDVRLAVQLFVVDELPAARVASIVGWPNAKAVYNRVYRALDAMRAALEREGVRRDDL